MEASETTDRAKEVPMRKVVASEFVSLDGVMEAPERWAFGFVNEELGRWTMDELLASEAILLGRKTYEGFADYWPSATDETGLADRMNGMPKFVVSTTLEGSLTWSNSTLIGGDAARRVSELKRRPGGEVLVLASADLVRALTRHGLVDEYRLRVAPVVVGSGKRLFEDGPKTTILELVETKRFGSGVVVLNYRPKRE
jgi:dihydrofolate reductase